MPLCPVDAALGMILRANTLLTELLLQLLNGHRLACPLIPWKFVWKSVMTGSWDGTHQAGAGPQQRVIGVSGEVLVMLLPLLL